MTPPDPQLIGSVIRNLLSALTNAFLYGMEHPQVTRLCELACQDLNSLLKLHGSLTMMVIDHELVVGAQPQPHTMFHERFVKSLKQAGITHLTFIQGLTDTELTAFVAAVAAQVAKTGTQPFVSSAHIQVGQVELRESQGGTNDSTTGPASLPRRLNLDFSDLPQEELIRFAEICETAGNNGALHLGGIYEIVESFLQAFQTKGAPLLVAAALRDTDEYTFTHSSNVCILNMAQAMSLGISGQMLSDIGTAALLHDIGKLFVPQEVLTKEGKLTDEEFAQMKAHPVKGARYLMKAAGVPRIAIVSAYEHHMKANLTGYPPAPPGWQLNLVSHLTMISDIFDALRTRRPYRAPMEPEQIASIMGNMSGTELHPLLMQNFMGILFSEEYRHH